MSRRARPLNAKQQRFVQEYLVDLNATQAAIRAGYSEKTANEQGSRLLANVSVAAAVHGAMAALAEKIELTAEWVCHELVANARKARAANDFAASNRALELLGKHLGAFPDKLNIDFREVAKLSDEELEDKRRKLRLVG